MLLFLLLWNWKLDILILGVRATNHFTDMISMSLTQYSTRDERYKETELRYEHHIGEN